jgi:hypothetical protein
LPPPTLEEARIALQRTYNNAVSIDENSAGGLIVGDFNGDGYQDLAAHVRATAAFIRETNTQLANWIVEDPALVRLPDLSQRVMIEPVNDPVVRLHDGERLLIVLHGYGPQGWRDSNARQTFVLANEQPAFVLMPLKQLKNLNRDPHLPHIQGDLICQSPAQLHRCLFWTGAGYAFFPKPVD